jgi:hypothetical protein
MPHPSRVFVFVALKLISHLEYGCPILAAFFAARVGDHNPDLTPCFE